jgi:hypothetical protein
MPRDQSERRATMRAMPDNSKAFLIPVVLVAAFFAIPKVLIWWGSQPSRLPKDMPRSSIWIQAPNVPFSWDHGWWFGCWTSSDGTAMQTLGRGIVRTGFRRSVRLL